MVAGLNNLLSLTAGPQDNTARHCILVGTTVSLLPVIVKPHGHVARFFNLARAMAMPCNLLKAKVIEDPLGITAKIHAPFFAVDKFRHAHALTKELAKAHQPHAGRGRTTTQPGTATSRGRRRNATLLCRWRRGNATKRQGTVTSYG
jgi:hypothetical protein